MAGVSQGSLPFRYARALISLAEEAQQVEVVAKDLENLQGACRQLPKLLTLLADVIVPRSERSQVLGELLAQVSASELVRRFCRFLLDKERFASFDGIVKAYARLCDERAGLLRAKVRSAVTLSSELAGRIEKLLVDKTGHKVAVEYEEDPNLIGGILLQIGSRIYDGSVRGELRRAQELMLKQTDLS